MNIHPLAIGKPFAEHLNAPDAAALQVFVGETGVIDILAKAEIIVPGHLKLEGSNQHTAYVLAPNERWDDLKYAISEAERIVTDARHDHLRKRLHGVL